MSEAFISLGTNMGNKQKNLEDSKKLIAQKAGNIQRSSSIYETEPWGFLSDENFLNQVILINTRLEPEDLLESLLQTERKMGRIRISGKGYIPRIIDLDILFYDDRIISEEFLTVPHPHIADRKFILIPLNEIAGSYVHPVYHKKINVLLQECKDLQAVKKR